MVGKQEREVFGWAGSAFTKNKVDFLTPPA